MPARLIVRLSSAERRTRGCTGWHVQFVSFAISMLARVKSSHNAQYTRVSRKCYLLFAFIFLILSSDKSHRRRSQILLTTRKLYKNERLQIWLENLFRISSHSESVGNRRSLL